MKKRISFASILLLIIALGSVAGAAVLTFDDVGGLKTSWNNPIYDGYGGFNWDQMYVLHKDFHPGTGYEKGVVSGEWAAYNAWDNITTINDQTFNFNGAYFTSAWDETNEITATGYINGIQKYTATYGINNQTPSWLQFDFLGIDTLTLTSEGLHFVMDDFTFTNTAQTAPVPEPATMLLFGAGLLGIGRFSRRKK